MQLFRQIIANPNEKYDIIFQPTPGVNLETVMTETDKELYTNIEHVNNIIKSLNNTSEEIKNKYFNKFLSLSQAGFLSETPSPTLALQSLEALKNEMLLIEGHRIKNKYMLYGSGAKISKLLQLTSKA